MATVTYNLSMAVAAEQDPNIRMFDTPGFLNGHTGTMDATKQDAAALFNSGQNGQGFLVRFTINTTSTLLRSASFTLDNMNRDDFLGTWTIALYIVDNNILTWSTTGTVTFEPFSQVSIPTSGNGPPAYVTDPVRLGWRKVGDITAPTTVAGTATLDMGQVGAAIYKSNIASGTQFSTTFVLMGIINMPDIADTISTTPASSTDLTLITDEVSTNTTARRTGLSGPVNAQSRADECPRCGTMTLRETWVRDGAQAGQRGILLCPACRDDPEPLPVMLRSERPGINEEG